MSFPGSTIEERFLRAAIRFCSLPSGGPAWDCASSELQELLWWLMNWPHNTCTSPPTRVYAGKTEAEIFTAGYGMTGVDRNSGESDFDYLGRLLNAELVGN